MKDQNGEMESSNLISFPLNLVLPLCHGYYTLIKYVTIHYSKKIEEI